MKKTKLLCLLALSSLILSSCGLTKKDSESESKPQESDTSEIESESQDQSDSSESDGPIVSNPTFETGKKANLEGRFEFASDSESVDGEVIHVDYDSAKDTTTIYTIDAGEAKLVSGNVTANITVIYGFISGEGENPLNLGNDYLAYQNQFLQASFRGSKAEPYVVGNQNKLKLDVGFTYNTYILEDGEYVKDRATLNLDEALAEKYLSTENNHFNIEIIGSEAGKTYGTVNDDLTVSLNEEAVGETLTFKVSVNGKSVEQTALVNDGVNVHDSGELKAYFEDEEFTGEINILRSFEAEYGEDQIFYVGDEGPYLYDTNPSYSELNYQGSIYFRYVSKNYADVPLTINGNYMVLDGTKLPLHFDGYPSDSGLPVEAQKTQAEPINGKVCNPQEGIFRTFTNGDDISITIKNYNIRGNSNVGSLEEPTTSSAGLIGFVSHRTDLVIENCILDYAVYGVASYSTTASLELKDSVISNTWGSSICTYRSSSVEVKNSLLTKAGGAAVNLLNNPREGEQGHLFIDTDSDIENYIFPDSSWFVAWDLTMIAAFAGTIDYAVNEGAAQANQAMGDTTSKPHTIYNNSKLNFVVLCQADSDIKDSDHDLDNYRPFAYVDVCGSKALINSCCYKDAEYQDGTGTSNLKLLSTIFASNGGSIIKPAGYGYDDAMFANTMRQVLNGVLAANGVDAANMTVDQILALAQMEAYAAAINQAISGSFANALSRLLTAKTAAGEKAYIDVDASIAGFDVGALIEVKQVA